MSEPKVYVGVFEWDAADRVWLATVEEEPGAHSFGKSLQAAQANLDEALALWLDAEPGEFEIRPDIRTGGDDVGGAVLQAKQARVVARAADEAASTATKEACAALVEEGLTMRDIGTVLGISHQRVHQLLRAARPSRFVG